MSLPVAGSLISSARPNDEEPVTMTWVLRCRSPIIFRVRPIFLTRCASSIKKKSWGSMSCFNSVEDLPLNKIRSSSLSQFNMRTLLPLFDNSFKSVLLPTCLGPKMLITLFRLKYPFSCCCRIRSIITVSVL